MRDVFCNQCGHRNPAAARYCSSCGAALDVTLLDDGGEHVDTEHHEHLVPQVLGRPCLVVEAGHRAGSTYPLDGETVRIGRHPDSDIFLDDVTVSRRHAELERSDDTFVVRDAGSLNGTYVNRRRTESARLASGDELQIGKFKLVYLRPESATA
ncbi:MAG: FHA domain-containing protein [Actinomycetota bacterium]